MSESFNPLFWLLPGILVGWFLLRHFLNFGKRVPAIEAAARVRKGKAVLVDVREPAEWRSGVAAPARLLPLSTLQSGSREWATFLAENADREILLYCQSGMRSGMAARLLARKKVRSANAGSFSSWKAAGLPVKKA